MQEKRRYALGASTGGTCTAIPACQQVWLRNLTGGEYGVRRRRLSLQSAAPGTARTPPATAHMLEAVRAAALVTHSPGFRQLHTEQQHFAVAGWHGPCQPHACDERWHRTAGAPACCITTYLGSNAEPLKLKCTVSSAALTYHQILLGSPPLRGSHAHHCYVHMSAVLHFVLLRCSSPGCMSREQGQQCLSLVSLVYW